MPTTTNFGWTTPADTDLVKDGASAIRTLGNGIDTSLLDLKGGTTGQVLSKASNTDLDYSWITPNVGDITEVQAGTGISIASGTGPIPVVTNTVATAYDAKGDLIVGTGADTFSRLAVGATNGDVLQIDSTAATGLKWGSSGVPTSWTSFTPTFNNLTVGNGTRVGKYVQIGKVMFVYVKFTMGSTSSVTGAIALNNLPASSVQSFTLPFAMIEDVGAANITGGVIVSGTTAELVCTLANGTYAQLTGVSGTVPMTWTTNDNFVMSFNYEVA